MSAASAAVAEHLSGKILVASSRAIFREEIVKQLGPALVPPLQASGGADALLQLDRGGVETLYLDSQLADLDSEELLATIQKKYPELKVIFGSDKTQQLAFALDENVAVEEEPQENAAEAAIELPSERESIFSARSANICESLPGMIGSSAAMQRIYRLARLVAPRDTSVLIVGATGTGKELIARGVHELSRRSKGPFVVVNCAAIPESLLEAELFGFARGAFTGAFQSRLGRIHAAHGGTLFLDEVGELPLSMQAKLLRFVQEGEVQRLGSSDVFRVDTRVIAATNADLGQRVREKQFREDLFYRLAVFPLTLPPLRQREEDILPLAQHFIGALCRKASVPAKRLSREAADLLCQYAFPGNVRELQHWMERAFVLAERNDCIRAEDLAMPYEVA